MAGYLPLSNQVENIAKSNVLGAVFIANYSISSEIESIPDTPCPCMLITPASWCRKITQIRRIHSNARLWLTWHSSKPLFGSIQPAPTVAADALRGPSPFPGIFFFGWIKSGPFLDLCVSSLHRVMLIFCVLFQFYRGFQVSWNQM